MKKRQFFRGGIPMVYLKRWVPEGVLRKEGPGRRVPKGRPAMRAPSKTETQRLAHQDSVRRLVHMVGTTVRAEQGGSRNEGPQRGSPKAGHQGASTRSSHAYTKGGAPRVDQLGEAPSGISKEKSHMGVPEGFGSLFTQGGHQAGYPKWGIQWVPLGGQQLVPPKAVPQTGPPSEITGRGVHKGGHQGGPNGVPKV